MIKHLRAVLGLDKTGFDAGMAAAGKQVNRFGENLKSSLAGAFSAAATVAFIRSVAETTNRIKDLADQFKITTDEVQIADHALKQSGLHFENLGASLIRLGQSRRAAVEGNEELRESFARYGVSLNDLNNPLFRNYDILMKISAALRGKNINAREDAQLTDLLGDKAAKLTGALASLSEIKPPKLFNQQDIEEINRATTAIQNLKLELQAMAAPEISRASLTGSGLLRGLKGFISGQVPEGSSVKKRSGGIAGRFELLADLFEESLLEPAAEGFSKSFFGSISDIAKKAMPNHGGLFEIDKNRKPERTERLPRDARPESFSIQGDAFSRIGAFTGAAAMASVTPAQQRQIDQLTKIHDALVMRGIIIKDVKR